MAFSLYTTILLLAGLAAANPMPGPQDNAIVQPGGPMQPAQCTFTKEVAAPTFNLNPTKTDFTTTTTVTSRIDCSGCNELVTSTARREFGVGPVVHFTTTVTAEGPSTTSVFACRPTPIPLVKPSN